MLSSEQSVLTKELILLLVMYIIYVIYILYEFPQEVSQGTG